MMDYIRNIHLHIINTTSSFQSSSNQYNIIYTSYNSCNIHHITSFNNPQTSKGLLHRNIVRNHQLNSIYVFYILKIHNLSYSSRLVPLVRAANYPFASRRRNFISSRDEHMCSRRECVDFCTLYFISYNSRLEL